MKILLTLLLALFLSGCQSDNTLSGKVVCHHKDAYQLLQKWHGGYEAKRLAGFDSIYCGKRK